MGIAGVLVALTVSICLQGVLSVAPGNTTCYNTTTSRYFHFSTKTLYEDVRGMETPQEQTQAGCQPSMFYLLARHGSRYPSDDDIELMIKLLDGLRQKIVDNYNNGTSSLCAADVKKLQSWTRKINMTDESKLAEVGYQEMVSLAHRFQVRYPTLLQRPYTTSDFIAQSTYKDRTKESAKGFLEGLFNRTDINPTFNAKGDDRLLRFYDSCKRYEDELDDVDVQQQVDFYKGSEYMQMIDDVTARLGFPPNALSNDDVFTMYRTCVYDHVLFDDSTWCAVFSEANLKVIEYSEDLDYFYSYSYGAPAFSRDQSCELQRDLISHIRKAAEAQYSGPKAVLRFAHSHGIQTFISALGLYQDQTHMTATNMASQANRKWQTSLVGPFGANIAFTVYTCQGNSAAKIQTFVNEKPINLPGCSENVCDLDQVLSSTKSFADTCDFDEICKNPTGHSSPLKAIPTSVLLSFFTWLFVLLLR